MAPTEPTNNTLGRSRRPSKGRKLPPPRLVLPVDPDSWWDAIQDLPTTPVAHLVDLTRIGKQPIPYSRLPIRARTYYSDDFSVGADLAQETITTLLSRPKAGIGPSARS